MTAAEVLAGRPRDLDDVRELVSRGTPDHAKIEATLALIEEALGQDDFRPLYARLVCEAIPPKSR